jgi:hypothetical protein
MKRLYKFSSCTYLILLTVTFCTGVFILTKNLEAQIYDAKQDSIGLPFSVMFAIWLTLTLNHLMQILLLRKSRTRFSASLIRKIPAYLLATVSLVILVESIVYWSIPNHAVIAIFYVASAITFIAFQVSTFAQLK